MRKKKLSFVFGFLIHSKDSSRNFLQFLKERYEWEPRKSETIGANPEVFYYQLVPPDENGLILFKLVFYEFTEFYISIAPEKFDVDSTLLGQIFKANMPIVLTLGDKEFKI